MLQTVLGLDAARIAASFLVAPASMGQRLVRAKRRIRDAGIAFAIPEAEDIPERLSAVLSAIYAAYGTAWDDVAGADPRLAGLADEAIWLARLTVQLAPDQPEALGLLAMMLHCEARRAARRGPDGAFIPLRDQDVALWSRDMMAEAEAALRAAAQAGRPGRFQTEAAIQLLHAQSRMTGERLHGPLARLYDVLAASRPPPACWRRVLSRSRKMARPTPLCRSSTRSLVRRPISRGGRRAPASSGYAVRRPPPTRPRHARPVSAAIPASVASCWRAGIGTALDDKSAIVLPGSRLSALGSRLRSARR
jgi:hypothetical protein